MASNIAPLSSGKLTSRLSTISILIADPDSHVASLLRDVLRNVGFTDTQIASSGEDALRIMRKRDIDILITDWRMQPLDGITLIEFIRNEKTSPIRFLPILMLTGRAELRDVEKARDSGVTEYLIKPFTAKSLLERIVTIIEKPRGFVVTKHYSGPDRRRRQTENFPPEKDRRKRSPTPKKPS